MHLSGLQQILNLRGGARNVGDTAGLPMLLEILDLSHAVYFHTSPLYTSAEPSRPSSNDRQAPAPPVSRRGELDQGMLDDISNFILSIPELAETGEELPGAESALDARQVQAQTQTQTQTYGGSRSMFEEEVELWHRVLSEARLSTTMRDEEGAALAHVCRLAADLHLLSTSAVRAHPMRIQTRNDELLESMSDVPDETWNPASDLHTRV